MCYGRNAQGTITIGNRHKALFTLILLWATEAAVVYDELPSKNCSDIDQSCGSLYIPYPFGTRAGCYMNEDFLITCNRSHDPPSAFLPKGNITVTDIWLWGELGVFVDVAQYCYDEKGGVRTTSSRLSSINLLKFRVSSTRNKFTAIGCDTSALIRGSSGTAFTTGCMSLCSNISDVVEGSCSGLGCCQTAIPKGVINYRIDVSSYSNHTAVGKFNPCSYAFVAEEGSYNFSSKDLRNFTKKHEKTKMVLNWAIGNQTCIEAAKDHPQKFACQNNSYCCDSVNGPGYWCNCSMGFEGNPYLPHGCQDINECERYPNLCHKNSTCINLNGAYNCSCLPGYEDDGQEIDGSGCKYIPESQSLPKSQSFPLMNRIALGIGTSLGVLFLIAFTSVLYKVIKKRSEIKLKKKFFKKNGGLLLERQLSSNENNVQNTKLFNSKELEKATDRFSKTRIVGKGGQGTVFKGMLSDGRIVAIKKCNTVYEGNLEQFINEIVILSQINHRNVVKLIGCCLEVEIPLLVYEFIPNGTLFQYLQEENEEFPLTWDMRLKIATEIAGSLFYLHSAASSPIYHRDIKSTNILLDEKYKAKIADFGTSKLVTIDQTHVTTLVQGTFGYLDPEYFQTSQFTEKSDVYSFGVVLIELLTGEKTVSSARSEESRSLSAYFILSMKENHLFDILDDRVKKGDKEEVIKVANLAKRCLHLNGKKRPTMREVATELQGIRKTSDDKQHCEELQFARSEEIGPPGVSFTSTQSCFEIASSSSSIVIP